ncbi:2-dehydro-3-deoxygalactonokinase [Sphingomonas ginkgonis]|uniref:2-dehydro-3-deoxygalactonokinase n=1 Tax=Sphingomonas ginkgonis TaxID=2315330 RepID=A0A3R9X930_9SPHN|nr:2-dehydro-3-deoxygalactonokinase [Sphingomonas ginkgonis]RST31639.1 2-dehydro-3-deoxygalactonokinase [Sphingomonas ginkgonis]
MISLNSYIAVDWGTTNRRAYRIGPDGRNEAEFEDGKGILSLSDGGFAAAVGEIRERLGDLPLLMAGMIGSNRGWKEAPYVPCPAGLDEIAAALVWPEPDRSAIVPGASFVDDDRADVMRGEEVQLLGAVAAGLIGADALACHPGTHNKWVRLAGGRIAEFRTVMTGELFNLLKEKSILAELLHDKAEPDAAFRAGVRQGLKGEALTADLFSARARVLLGRLDRADASSWVSGLLIGGDVRTGTAGASGEVAVMGRPELTALYAAALDEAGFACREVDGEQAFLAGIAEIARRLS